MSYRGRKQVSRLRHSTIKTTGHSRRLLIISSLIFRLEGMAYCKCWFGQRVWDVERGFEQRLNTFGLDHSIPG